MTTPGEKAPAGRLIGPPAGGRASYRDLLRSLTVGSTRARPGLPLEAVEAPAPPESDDAVRAQDEVRDAIARFDREARGDGGGGAAVDVLSKYLDDPRRLRQLTPGQRVEASARRARYRRGAGLADWLIASCLSPEQVPAAVIPDVAIDRIVDTDDGPLALRFYLDHVEEIDRVIKERPNHQRDDLLHNLERVCLEGSSEAEALALVRRLIQLNPGRAGLTLSLAMRLFHAGEVDEAEGALRQAEEARQRPRASELRRWKSLFHLYRGAVWLERGEADAARKAFRRSAAVAPEQVAARLMYAEVDHKLGARTDRITRQRSLKMLERVERGAALRGRVQALVLERCRVLRQALEGDAA